MIASTPRYDPKAMRAVLLIAKIASRPNARRIDHKVRLLRYIESNTVRFLHEIVSDCIGMWVPINGLPNNVAVFAEVLYLFAIPN